MQVFLTRAGVTYTLTDSNPFEIIEIDGISVAPSNLSTERGPLQHGESVIDFRLEPRTIMLKLQAHSSATHSYQYLRNQINKLFGPYNADLYLTVVWSANERGALELAEPKRIAVRSIGSPNIVTTINQTLNITAVIALRASDPIWFDPNLQLNNLSGNLIGNGMQVPTQIPLFIGVGSFSASTDLTYAGTWLEYPLIRLDGPLGSPVIENISTGEKIDLTGTIVPDGSVYIVDLRYAAKRIYDEADPSTNLTYLATSDSDLATFALQPDPVLAGGVNTLRTTAGLVTADSGIFINYYNRYSGI